MKLTIGHLYPELLNLYGDRGNIECMKMRLRWRGIDAEIKPVHMEDDVDFTSLDIVLLGGGSDREQAIVCGRLREIRKDFCAYASDGGTVLAVCGGYQLLGSYYDTPTGRITGIELLELYTEQGTPRLISNCILESDAFPDPIVGFENHGGRTQIGSLTPFGHVLYGFGNNGQDGTEGVRWNNVIGTYLHGPLLPKNPAVCDALLLSALERKYGVTELTPLPDEEEREAREGILRRFSVHRNK